MTRILFILLLVAAPVMAQPRPLLRGSPFAENLAFYYSLDGSTVGGKVYADDWGTNVLSNVGTSTSTNGIVGNAWQGNGSTRALLGATNLATHVSNGVFTVAFWCQTTVSNQAYAGTVGKNADPSSPYSKDEWRFDYRNGAHNFNIGNTGGSRAEILSTNLQLASEWTLVVGWGDGATIYLQVNTSRAKMTETGLYQTASLSGKPMPGCCSQTEIGRNRGGSYFNGRIDDVALWTNRVLTAEQRHMLWNEGRGGLGRFVVKRNVNPQ